MRGTRCSCPRRSWPEYWYGTRASKIAITSPQVSATAAAGTMKIKSSPPICPTNPASPQKPFATSWRILARIRITRSPRDLGRDLVGPRQPGRRVHEGVAVRAAEQCVEAAQHFGLGHPFLDDFVRARLEGGEELGVARGGGHESDGRDDAG